MSRTDPHVPVAPRELRAALAAAPDDKLGRVVGMLDGMLDRSEADALLAPIRPRLRWLRPARPLRFPRLLALPLEGGLVAPADFTGAPAEIPRSALTPLAEAVQAALGEAAEEIEFAACGHTVADTAVVGRLGRRLWPLAAAARLPLVPPGWAAVGLPHAAAGPVLALSAALWRHGAALWEARMAHPAGPPEALLRSTLGRLVPEGPAALAAAAVLLLRDAAAPARVVLVAVGLCPVLAAPLERALAEELARHAASLAEATTAGMAEGAAALADRLAELEALATPADGAARRALAARLRTGAAEACRARFAAALEEEVLAPAARLAACLPVQHAEVVALRAAAEDLRRLAAAARRLGAAAGFDVAPAAQAALAIASASASESWPRL